MNPQAIFNRSDLRSALALACKVTEKKTTTPILANVAIRSDAAGATIQATDCDIQATFTLSEALADDGFGLTIPAHVLRDIDRKAPASDDAVVDIADGRATIRAGRVSFDVAGIPLTDWPEMRVEGAIRADVTLPRSAILDAIEFCSEAMSTEETRYYLNGVYIHATTDALRLVATDGHRLRVRDIPAAGIDGDISGLALTGDAPEDDVHSVIIPAKTVAFLVDVLRRKSAPDSVSIIVNSTKARVVSGNVDVVTKLVDGTFPDYMRVVPVRNDRLATVSRAELAECVKAVTCMAETRAPVARFKFSAGSLSIVYSNPDAGNSHTTMPAEYAESDPLTIGFNAAYLMAECRDHDGETMRLAFADAASPAMINYSEDGAARFSVLMPMRA